LEISDSGVGSTAEVICHASFSLIGISTYTCNIDENWIGNGSCGNFSLEFHRL